VNFALFNNKIVYAENKWRDRKVDKCSGQGCTTDSYVRRSKWLLISVATHD